MTDVNRHLVGLLLGQEEDWPRALEGLSGLLGTFSYAGRSHAIDVERVKIAPFNL
ncbi:MAG: hypothetical protein QOK30_2487, partial [Nocardioidaceae bacterium]|nr:hypothetical protein [Nocardioidaceae bacterium]